MRDLRRRGPRTDPAHLDVRARTVLGLLDPGTTPSTAGPSADALAARLARADVDEVWLTLAVSTGTLPTWQETEHAARVLRSDGPAALDALSAPRSRDVRVVTDTVLLDVSDVAAAVNELGAADVGELLLRHWQGRDGVERVRWSADGTRLVAADDDPEDDASPSVVPWGATVVSLRLPTAADTADRMRALAEHARSRTAAIGFGEPAVVAGDRTPGEAAGAAHALAAMRHVTVVAAVSPVAEEQYLGWRDMVRTLELPGPDVVCVPLADEAPQVPAAVRDDLAATFDPAPLPLVVSTGGLGPRGNQLLVLRAANTLWRAGAAFQLVLVGDEREDGTVLDAQVDRLRTAGYPVWVVHSPGADRLAALVETAACLVDVPLHDPVGYHAALARALDVPVVTVRRDAPAAGTPTSTAVDPDDSTELAALLGATMQSSTAQQVRWRAAPAPQRPWHTVADELWRALAGAPALGAG